MFQYERRWWEITAKASALLFQYFQSFRLKWVLPCLCRRPHRRVHRPGRGYRRHHAPTGGPAASS